MHFLRHTFLEAPYGALLKIVMVEWMSQMQYPILVIGVGNAFRSDDAVGLIVAQKLREKHLNGVMVAEAHDDGAALMEMWGDAGDVILVDAIQSGAEPGTLHRFDAHSQPMPAGWFGCSTHAFNVAEAVELARALDRLPSRLIVYGVEGKSFEIGGALSPEVEASAQSVVERIVTEVNSWRVDD